VPSGDAFLVFDRLVLALLAAIPLSMFMPRNPSPVSIRGIGVAVGSTETTELTGKTRSVALGLSARSFAIWVGEVGMSVAPEKMLTELFFGITPTVCGRTKLVFSEGRASDTVRRGGSERSFRGVRGPSGPVDAVDLCSSDAMAERTKKVPFGAEHGLSSFDRLGEVALIAERCMTHCAEGQHRVPGQSLPLMTSTP
jgi:hypothetical protein